MDKRTLVDPRREIQKRTAASVTADPRQSELERAAQDIAKSIENGSSATTFPQMAVVPQTLTAHEMEVKAMADLARAAELRRKEQVDNSGQVILLQALLDAYLWYTKKGLDPAVAAAMVNAYARFESALTIKAGLEGK